MKASKIELKIIDFIEKHLDLLFIVAMTLISMYIRYQFRGVETSDYTHYLSIWFDQIKNSGGFHALKESIGNYNQPYLIIIAILTYIPIKSLYSIKIVSIVFDYLLAIVTSLFIYKKTQDKKIAILTYIIICLSPNVMLNSALWAQCDAIYTLFIIASLYFLLEKKYTLSFIMLGISFAFKLQFIFIAPLYIIYYFNKKDFSLLNFLIIPLMVIILSLPSIIMGHSIIDCFAVYLNQTGYYQNMTMNMFNFWLLFPNSFEIMQYLGYGLLLLFFGVLAYLMIKCKYNLNEKSILTLGLLSVLVCVFFLPNMHERYLYVGDILAIIWYFMHKKNIYIPIGINLISFCSYMPFLFGGVAKEYWFIPIIYAIIIFILCKIFIDEIHEKEKSK